MKSTILKCPICNHDVEFFDICDNCNYQNSGPNENEKSLKGPNKMTLKEAKGAYKKGIIIE